MDEETLKWSLSTSGSAKGSRIDGFSVRLGCSSRRASVISSSMASWPKVEGYAVRSYRASDPGSLEGGGDLISTSVLPDKLFQSTVTNWGSSRGGLRLSVLRRRGIGRVRLWLF